jgi:3-hydroxypropanoate dehydrogenase
MGEAARLARGLILDPRAQDLLFRQARSATEFTADPVSDEQVEAIYDLCKYGPTSFNEQPLRIRLARSSSALARLLPCVDERNRSRVAAAPLTVILAADLRFHDHLPEVFPHLPTLRETFEADPDTRVDQARYNALLQIGYFIVGVRAAGLAAGPVIGFDAAAVDREFFADTDLRSLLLVMLGTPLPKRYERLPRLDYRLVVDTL